jgi:hypothetical protein
VIHGFVDSENLLEKKNDFGILKADFSNQRRRALKHSAVALGLLSLSALAVEKESNDFWDTTGYEKAQPIVQYAVAELAIGVEDSVPACSPVLAVFDSYSQRGLTFVIR